MPKGQIVLLAVTCASWPLTLSPTSRGIHRHTAAREQTLQLFMLQLSMKLSDPHGNSLGVIASEPSTARLRHSLTLGLEEEEHGGSWRARKMCAFSLGRCSKREKPEKSEEEEFLINLSVI